MDTNPNGTTADPSADCDHLITPALFWALLLTLAALVGIVLAVALA